ncbi:MAG TPA: GNAT family N-acetyltransferase [Anaerolineae bacterium]|nr:GNAT family N-acetyltransferase [Anaerolineae bacterium]
MVIESNSGRYDDDIKTIEPEFVTEADNLVLMRLIRADDAPLLIDLVSQLSAESRQRRFHTDITDISGDVLMSWAKELASVDNETLGGAVVAEIRDELDGRRIVGVARLGRLPSKPADPVADAAVVVRDDYQEQGVGRELLRRLVLLARQMNVLYMSAFIEADNTPAIRLFEDLELPTETTTVWGETTMLIEMPT